MYFRCGFFHGLGKSCPGSGDGELMGLRATNMVGVKEEAVADGMGENCLGPWLVAVQ